MSEETKDVEATEEVEVKAKKGKSKKGKAKEKKSVDVGAMVGKGKAVGSSVLTIVKGLFVPDIKKGMLFIQILTL